MKNFDILLQNPACSWVMKISFDALGIDIIAGEHQLAAAAGAWSRQPCFCKTRPQKLNLKKSISSPTESLFVTITEASISEHITN